MKKYITTIDGTYTHSHLNYQKLIKLLEAGLISFDQYTYTMFDY